MIKKLNKKIVLLHFIVLIVFILFYLQPFGCPFLYLTGIKCPTCGVSHALLALLKGDIKSYLFYNPIALPAMLLFFYALHGKIVFKNKKIYNSIVIIGSVFIFIFYLINVIFS